MCCLSARHRSFGCCLGQVRAFTKKTGHKPDFSDPVVLSADRGGITVDHLCARLHATLAKQFHYALVWGTSAKHYPQRYACARACVILMPHVWLHALVELLCRAFAEVSANYEALVNVAGVV